MTILWAGIIISNLEIWNRGPKELSYILRVTYLELCFFCIHYTACLRLFLFRIFHLTHGNWKTKSTIQDYLKITKDAYQIWRWSGESYFMLIPAVEKPLSTGWTQLSIFAPPIQAGSLAGSNLPLYLHQVKNLTAICLTMKELPTGYPQ